MKQITLNCESCQKVWHLDKTPEIPEHVFLMKCNWCPNCEDTAEDYYNEWWDEDDNDGSKEQIPVDPINQLVMPFELDRITKQLEYESTEIQED